MSVLKNIYHNDYFIGWVIGHANIYDDKICFFIKKHDKDIVSKLYDIIINHYNIDLNAIYYNITKSHDFYLQIKSTSLSRDIIYKLHLKSKNTYRSNYYLKNYILFSNLSNPSNVSNLSNPSNSFLYIRGLFESKGFLYRKNGVLFCGLRSFSEIFLQGLLNHISFIFTKKVNYKYFIRFNRKYSNYYILLISSNAHNFLNYIYKEELTSGYILNRKYDLYKLYRSGSCIN